MACQTISAVLTPRIQGSSVFSKRQHVNKSPTKLIVRCTSLEQGADGFSGKRPQPRLNTRVVKVKGIGERLKNFVTGGAADVSLIISEPAYDLREPFDVTVAVEANSDIEFSRVYLEVFCFEKITNFSVSTTELTETVTDYETVVSMQIPVAEPGELQAGENAEYQAQVALPSEASPSFQGRYISCEWSLKAVVDTGLKGGVNPSTPRTDITIKG
ncbi:hypothetical protein CYMTET_3530 [Cymbomonas tetramitiformis]|uniref:Uncharacterized protein n=1 Tax=Cymbomonas tetramitiformis TaxID=36881 RepID=A0AAE0H2X8_9CHLO|nr:hypothetical protein CYMTET_3530 [Cymbomonas tetramitiformis]